MFLTKTRKIFLLFCLFGFRSPGDSPNRSSTWRRGLPSLGWWRCSSSNRWRTWGGLRSSRPWGGRMPFVWLWWPGLPGRSARGRPFPMLWWQWRRTSLGDWGASLFGRRRMGDPMLWWWRWWCPSFRRRWGRSRSSLWRRGRRISPLYWRRVSSWRRWASSWGWRRSPRKNTSVSWKIGQDKELVYKEN